VVYPVDAKQKKTSGMKAGRNLYPDTSSTALRIMYSFLIWYRAEVLVVTCQAKETLVEKQMLCTSQEYA